jgi:hypothetical protein
MSENPTSRYALFAGSCYYPAGGWNDHRGTFATMFEAIAEAARLGEDWHHIIDLDAHADTQRAGSDRPSPAAICVTMPRTWGSPIHA